jgi:guanylate kinase
MSSKLFSFSAPSGCGKTTILKEILKIFPDIYFSISATTRQKREGEQHGKDYYFLTKEEFQKHLDDDDFIEWNEHFNNLYGTLKSDIVKLMLEEKDIIFDLDVNGTINLKKYDPNTISIFIKPPNIEVLKQRLAMRGTETNETIEIRLRRAEEEIEKSKNFDYIVINDDVSKALEEVKNIILKNK